MFCYIECIQLQRRLTVETLKRELKLSTLLLLSLQHLYSKSSLTYTANLDFNDMTCFNILTLTLALKIGVKYFKVDQFKLCLNLLSHNLRYCDSQSRYLYQAPVKEFTKIFKEFIIEWYALKKVTRSANFNESYLKEIERRQTFMSHYLGILSLNQLSGLL